MESNQYYNDQQDTIFTDDFFGKEYQPASKGQRFLNWFIDNLVMNWGVTWITGTLTFMLLGMIDEQLIYEINADEHNDSFLLFWLGISVINYLIYYTLCEKLFKGVTAGKLITGTRAVRDDGAPLTFRDTFLRSLARLVPFEPLSIFFDRPWHDSWTRTSVVKK